MAADTPKKRHMLNHAEVVEVGMFLKTVVRMCPAIGSVPSVFCEYVSPWDDASVAEKFDCTVANVAGLRKQMFGNLKPPPDALPAGRLDAVEQAVALETDVRQRLIEPHLKMLHEDLRDVMDYLTRQNPEWRTSK